MKKLLSLWGLGIWMTCSLFASHVSAQTTALQRARAFVCMTTPCFNPGQNPPAADVQRALVDLAEIENDCRLTTKGITSIPDRIGFARAFVNDGQDLMVLMLDFKPIARKHCASISLDDMLNAYVLERNKKKASHSATVAALLVDPQRLVKKWKGKHYRSS